MLISMYSYTYNNPTVCVTNRVMGNPYFIFKKNIDFILVYYRFSVYIIIIVKLRTSITKSMLILLNAFG